LEWLGWVFCGDGREDGERLAAGDSALAGDDAFRVGAGAAFSLEDGLEVVTDAYTTKEAATSPISVIRRTTNDPDPLRCLAVTSPSSD